MYFSDDNSMDDENEFKVFARPCSSEQLDYLRRLTNIKSRCLQTLVMERFDKRPEELSATEAYELIDELKSRG